MNNNKKLCENKKWELVNFCEFDKYAEKSYCAIHNVDPSRNLGDITKVDENNLSPFNMICGGSPCFVAGTKVFTKNGYKNIEDIKVGDMVLTHRNRFMPVLRNGGEVDKEIYKLKVQGFLETECTDYHPFYCRKTKNSEPEKIKLKDLKKGYYVGSHINTKSENTYNLSDEDCWILGRYIADGHIRKDKRKNRKNSYQYQCILSIGSNKVDELKDIVKNRHYSCYPHAKSTHRVVFSSMELVEFILEHNFGTGAENKIIPNFILDLPVHKLEYFLEGYMAGDGCNIGNIYQATTVSKELAMSLCLAIQKVYHVGCYIYYDKRPDACIIEDRVVSQKSTYMIRFRKNSQKHLWFIENDIVWYPIREISKTDKVENVYNIEVEEDHTYTANNIITYNCQDFSVAGKQKGSIWTCKDCSHEYNPLTVHWSERDKCPHCGSTNLEKTRSSLLVEYLRVIRANKPNFGIYENVKNIVGKQFKETTFKLFTDELEEYGYNVYWKVLNAKHYGIPQNRERVYLIFIKKELDNGLFKFPEPFDNGTRLKDILENKVDEKYYISEEKVKKFIKNIHTYKSNTSNEQHFIGNINRPDFGTGYAGGVWDKNNISHTLTTMQGGGRQPRIIAGIVSNCGEKFEKEVDVANTLLARDYKGFGNQGMNAVVEIPQATKKGYIADAKQYYDDINKSVQVLMNTDASKYSSQFKEIGDQLNTAAIKANEFNQALSGEGENGFQKHLQSVAEEIKKLNMDDADFKAAVASGDVDSINYLVEAAKNAGIITGTSASEIQPLITALGNLGYISNMSADGLNNVADSADNVEMSFSDLAKEDSSSLLQEISAVQEALDSQSIGVSVSYDDFNSDALADYRDCLEFINGSLVLNEENVKKLTKEKVEEQVATNNTAKAQKQQEYLENAKQIEALRQKLLDNTDATGKSAESIQEQIDGLLASNDAIVEQCSQLDLLNSSLMESIGIYQQWKDAQNASESGDMFDDSIKALSLINDTLNNTESDSYGRIGRQDYKTSLDLVIPDTVDKSDEDAINSYLNSIDNLFTHNDKGEKAGLNIEQFCKQAMDKGLMVLDESGENYQVAGGKTMEDFAEGMNLAMPMVQSAFGEMSELGATWDFSDEGIQTMGDIAVAATEASEALRSVAGNEDLKINLDVSDLETTEEKCSALDDTISEMNSVKAKVGVDSSEVDQANTIIQCCVAQKQQLEAPAVMNVDVSQVSGKIGEAVGLLQEFQTAQNTLQMQETLGMDTSEAQANVEAVADKIKGLDTNVKATLSIDDSSIDTIQDSINSKLTNEVMVKAGIDDSAIIGFQETKHDAKGEVDWDNDTTKVDAYAAAQKKSDGTVLWSNDISQVKTQFQAVGHINWGNTSAPTNGANSVNGTAHASGTAKANGDWGNKRPGTTLVGELGREMCVNPHTGKWYTVGDNGAEFTDIPQGAIVFNHVQTEELLSNGFTASRAVALASGTSPDISGKALVSGNAMVTGGISVKQAQKSVVSGGNTAKATSATNADTKATQSHTKATEESTEATKKSMKTFDWVATRLETCEKKVKKISDQITDYITSALKTSLLKKQMKTMSKEISSNTKGELAYMKKANSVAEKYTYYNSDGGEINVSIPKKYQKLVQSGAYRIEDMDTSTDEGKALAEAISEYQSWYDKAQDCKQAVIDLRNEQQKLFEQWANMPTEKAEKKIDRLTTGYNGINAISSRLTAATKGGSIQAVLAQTMQSDLTDAKDQKKSDNKALKSAKTANKKASSEKKKADNKVKSTAKSLLKTNLTDEQKKQVKSGKKLDTTGMSGSQKKKADAYNKAVTNKSKANKKATSAKSKLSTAKSNYNSSNSTYNSMKSNVNEALTAYDSGDSLSYMNSLVDQQVSGKKLEQNARKTAVEQANANLTTTKKQKTTANKKLAKLQKKYKNSKNLTAAQKKKIVAGKEIDTTGITDAKQLKILTVYNNALADSKKKKENVTIATNALAEANENLMTAEVESAQATVEAVSTKFDNAKTYYEALLSYQEQLSKYQEKNIDLAKAHGDYEKSSDYDVKISNTQAERAIKQNELDELTKQLNDGVEAGTIVENSQEWLDMQTKIKEAQNAVADYDTQIEELKQSQIGVYYEEQFERAAEKVDRFRDKLDGLKSLISDDMKIDKNTGLLTESGALAITLDVDDIQASTENLKTYIKERQQIINDYNAGKFGEDEYNQKLKDVDADIKSTTANIYSSRNSILELVKSQSQAELDVLNKVIDKRKEALSAKKSYYDYDKTLKNKTKDIEVLERQIAALEGSTSAEDKARKAKLQEQLQSAKDDLNDTIVDHAYSMQTDSLDKLSTDLSEDLDIWINKISSNMEEMTNAINSAISGAGLSTASTINAISSILKHYGLSDSEISQSGLTDIKGYASGTDYVPKSGIYRVNEKGMESVFSKQYGTLTFLNQGDKVFDANFTKSLLDNATIATQKNMPDYAGMAKAIEKNIQNIQNLSGNTYVNNFYIDGAQDTDSILKEIDKHLDKKIQAHDKKQVRDFRSLH